MRHWEEKPHVYRLHTSWGSGCNRCGSLLDLALVGYPHGDHALGGLGFLLADSNSLRDRLPGLQNDLNIR